MSLWMCSADKAPASLKAFRRNFGKLLQSIAKSTAVLLPPLHPYENQCTLVLRTYERKYPLDSS